MILQSVVDIVGSTGSGWLATTIKILVAVITAVIFVVKGLDHVEKGDLALKTRFGQIVHHRFGPNAGKPKIVGPGLRVLVPFVHSLRKINVQQRLGILITQIRQTEDGRYEEVHTRVFFTVVHVPSALLVSQDLEGSVMAICEAKLRLLLAKGASYDEIPQALKDMATPEVAMLGVEINRFMIVNTAATSPTQFFMQLTRSLAGVDVTPQQVLAGLSSKNGHGNSPPAGPPPALAVSSSPS